MLWCLAIISWPLLQLHGNARDSLQWNLQSLPTLQILSNLNWLNPLCTTYSPYSSLTSSNINPLAPKLLESCMNTCESVSTLGTPLILVNEKCELYHVPLQQKHKELSKLPLLPHNFHAVHMCMGVVEVHVQHSVKSKLGLVQTFGTFVLVKALLRTCNLNLSVGFKVAVYIQHDHVPTSTYCWNMLAWDAGNWTDSKASRKVRVQC